MVVLRPLAESSATRLQWPPGDEMSSYNLSCTVTVVDYLQASSSLSSIVRSSPSEGLNISTLHTAMYLEKASSALALNDAELIAQASSAVSYFLNAVNCTVPTPCVALNRKSCSPYLWTMLGW